MSFVTMFAVSGWMVVSFVASSAAIRMLGTRKYAKGTRRLSDLTELNIFLRVRGSVKISTRVATAV